MPRNRSVPDVREKREAWKKHISESDANNLVFLDESGVNINMTGPYARSKTNEQAVDSTPVNTQCNTTILSSIRLAGKTDHTRISGRDNGEAICRISARHFNTNVSEDDMHSHHVKTVKQILDTSEIRYLYLTPCSPDLNSIEKMWSKIKAYLRKVKARTTPELPNAIERAFSTVHFSDCAGWFRSCDYMQ